MIFAVANWWARLWRRKSATSERIGKAKPALVISRQALDAIIEFEVGGRAYYDQRLKRPTWPGGASGVTIGIGYDIGYNSPERLREDWGQHLSREDIALLTPACTLKSSTAREWLRRHAAAAAGIQIPFEKALAVFEARTLPRYAADALRAWPGMKQLPPDATGALLSIVFNRGSSLQGPSRAEMRAIKVITDDGYVPSALLRIAEQITSMKRLWRGKGLPGLLKRRDAEARLVIGACRKYPQADLVCIYT